MKAESGARSISKRRSSVARSRRQVLHEHPIDNGAGLRIRASNASRRRANIRSAPMTRTCNLCDLSRQREQGIVVFIEDVRNCAGSIIGAAAELASHERPRALISDFTASLGSYRGYFARS